MRMVFLGAGPFQSVLYFIVYILAIKYSIFGIGRSASFSHFKGTLLNDSYFIRHTKLFLVSN